MQALEGRMYAPGLRASTIVSFTACACKGFHPYRHSYTFPVCVFLIALTVPLDLAGPVFLCFDSRTFNWMSTQSLFTGAHESTPWP